MISVMDHGFLFGDSLYEVIRTYEQKPYGWKAHYQRLQDSASLSYMELAQSENQIKDKITQTLGWFYSEPQNKGLEAYARIIVTRGIGGIGFGKSYLKTPSQLIIIVQACQKLTESDFEKGIRLQVVRRIRNDPHALSPAMKSGNYLNSLLSVLEAQEEGFDDSILCNREGHITEGSRMNIFYIRRGIAATAPFDIGILDGISRKLTFKLLKELNIPYRETRYTPLHLYNADEVFVTSTIKEVFPVLNINDHQIGNGKPGEITRKLKNLFQNRAKQESALS